MLDNQINEKNAPPRIIPSLVEGFNTIASHVYILIFPVLIDVFLWFGPMLRIRNLLFPAIMRAVNLSAAAYGEDGSLFMESSQRLWTAFLEGFNILSGLRTYPVGIPSLMIGQVTQQNPLGNLSVFEMNSANSAFLMILLISLIGIALGSIYYTLIASVASQAGGRIKINQLIKQALQSLLLSLILFLAILTIGLPLMCLFSSILLILPSLGMLPLTIMGMLLLWILLPLAFSPHGIFTHDLRATRSIFVSVKLVRNLMSVTGLFFISVLIISYGMDFLWSTPDPESWMLLIGIIGHAFISSGLIASTFIFYRNGLNWMNNRTAPNSMGVVEN